MASNILPLAGWGGIYPLTEGKQAAQSGNTRNISRVLVFKLGGEVRLPPVSPLAAHAASSARHRGCGPLTTGGDLFAQFCLPCHGTAAVGGGVIPDLRKSVLPARGRFLQHRSRRPPAA